MLSATSSVVLLQSSNGFQSRTLSLHFRITHAVMVVVAQVKPKIVETRTILLVVVSQVKPWSGFCTSGQFADFLVYFRAIRHFSSFWELTLHF